MKASKVTQYGIPTSEGGRACQLTIGSVKVFLTGPSDEENRYVAESLRSYWASDDEPEEGAPTFDFAGVASVCERIAGGAPLVWGEFSVGPWTPAVPDGWSWAVLDKAGAPVLLAHDAFEAARHFCRLCDGDIDTSENVGGPYRLPPDAVIAERAREERC
jgi:hypothetical protein